MEERLRAREKVERDRLVVADRARGLTSATIADRHGLSERQSRSIWTESLDAHEALSSPDPFEAVAEALARWDAVIERFAIVADEATQDSVKLGALKAQADALRTRLILAHAVGLLPRDLGLFRREADVRVVATKILRTLEAHNVPEEVFDALEQEFKSASAFASRVVASVASSDE